MKFEIRLNDRQVYRYKSGVKVSLEKRKRFPLHVVMLICYLASATLAAIAGKPQLAVLCIVLGCSIFVVFSPKAKKRRRKT